MDEAIREMRQLREQVLYTQRRVLEGLGQRMRDVWGDDEASRNIHSSINYYADVLENILNQLEPWKEA